MTAINNTSSSLGKKIAAFAAITLKGLGQIMLQENQFTGFIFLLGLFYSSLLMGTAALVATICGTATAFLLKYNKSEIDKGLYGISAALVGVAVMVFLKPMALSWIFLGVGSALATIIQHYFITRKIPVFTLPFVLVSWAIILIARFNFTELLLVNSPVHISSTYELAFVFKGFAQVIFQDNLVAGILFFIGVLISSPMAAMYGLLGGVLSALIAFQTAIPINEVNIGLFSYNAVLCAIVFTGTQLKDGLKALFSVALALVLSIGMAKFNLVALTFPFVLASSATLFFISKPYFELRNK